MPEVTYPFNRCLTIRVRETPRLNSGPSELSPPRGGGSPRSVSNGPDFGGVRATRLAILQCIFQFSKRITLWFENRGNRDIRTDNEAGTVACATPCLYLPFRLPRFNQEIISVTLHNSQERHYCMHIKTISYFELWAIEKLATLMKRTLEKRIGKGLIYI